MGRQSRLLLLGLSFALAACATAKPDFTVSRLEVSPGEATPGSTLSIKSGVRNDGKAAAEGPAALEIALYAPASTGAPRAVIKEWEQAPGSSLGPGEAVEDASSVRAPEGVDAGAYRICALADPDGRVAESSEDNNMACVPFTLVAGPPSRADLLIDKVTVIGPELASLKVKVKIRNAGLEPAGPFRIKAFRRTPRLPLYFTSCALTEGQLAAGSPPSCGDLLYSKSLTPGMTDEIEGYFNYVVAGAEFVRQPVRPDYTKPPVARKVDFMVDGCFPPEDGSPVYCAIDEIDEINNFHEATLKVR